VYGDALQELYSNAALFAIPSLLEGLPLSLLEAISYGRSVVASDIPPHVEVLQTSGPGARLVPTGDIDALAKAIDEALESPSGPEMERAEALSKRVRSEYTWERAAKDTAALYEQLLADRRTRMPRRWQRLTV
jgi:glycosyltransferase involved in cell wall biosynthesis